MDFKNKVIALVGPTGVGKTKLSIELALNTDSEIISCDSMQIYRGMDIGTAKATKEETCRAVHHLIDIKNPAEPYSVYDYVTDGKKALEDIFKRNKNALIVGGTGLYADSLIKDTDFVRAGGDDGIRNELTDFLNKNGAKALHKMLEEIDSESAEAIHENNTKRVIRAIEYFRITGEKISDHNKASAMQKSPYDHVYIGLTRDRAELYDRIDKRVDIMVSQGLVDEVFKLYKNGCRAIHTSMQALGYKELIHYIEGRCTLDEAIRILKRDSRRYAKRQLTWFKRNEGIHWINLSQTREDDALGEILEILQTEFL